MVLIPLLLLFQVVTMALGGARLPRPADIKDADRIVVTDPEIVGSLTSSLREKPTVNVKEIQSPKISLNEEPSSLAVDVKDGAQLKDLTDDLLTWEAPIWYQKYCPYYHAGFDDEGRPVWIMEYGKYPLKELAELNDEGYHEFDKYIKQLSTRILKSILAQNATGIDVNQASFIIDWEGLDVVQLSSSKSILFLLKIFTSYSDLINKAIGSCILINVNFVTQMAINMVKPVLGSAFEKIEVYGTNAAKWKAILRRRFPKNTLPPWYGGSADFKPIQVYG